MKKILLVSLLMASVVGFSAGPKKPTSKERTKIVTALVRGAVENYHYNGKKIDSDVSRKAFKQFLQRLDYGKQFLLKSDVKKLKKHENDLGAQFSSDDPFIVKESIEIHKARIKDIQKIQKEVFKKNFNFTKSEYIEMDPDKRNYLSSNKELKELWRKLFKQATLNRYISLLEEKKTEIEQSKKKAAKKDKKPNKDSLVNLSKKQLQKKAQKAINKKYKKFFANIEKDEYGDYLEKFINAVTSVFDPHTVYFPPRKKEDFDIEMSGSLEGIGAVLQEDGSYIKVVEIVPGGAAWRQKELEVDDIILMVAQGSKDPVDLVDMRVDEAVRYIRGKKGTEVRLTVKKIDGTRKVVPIIRDVVETGASFAKSSVLESKKLGIKVGYIQLPKFYRDFGNADQRNCTEDVRKELLSLKKVGVDAVVLDLRNNGGGALEDARQMSGLFIKKGPIVQVRNGQGQNEIWEDQDSSITYGGPLIVLVNRFSAPASEILAGAMQDYGRAVVVGSEYTHGKGTVQVVYDLNRGPILSLFGPTIGALKITVQKFYRVTGASTQYKGVTPDIFLPDLFSYAENREKDLDYSLPWDEVAPLKYTPWKNPGYDIAKLKVRSGERVKKDKRFTKIRKNIAFLKKRQEDTKYSLRVDQVLKEEARNKKLSKELKLDSKNEDIIVSHFETAMKSDKNKKITDMKKWKEDFKKRKDEWIEKIQKDPGVEEALYIADDMLRMISKKGLR